MQHGGFFDLGPLAERETCNDLQTRSPEGQMMQWKKQTNNKNQQE